MKIFNFHLMPYADVDIEAIRKHGTSWITFPNTYYDPVKGAELYNLADDPLQRVNLWDDPAHRATRDELIADLWDHLPDAVDRRSVDAPV